MRILKPVKSLDSKQQESGDLLFKTIEYGQPQKGFASEPNKFSEEAQEKVSKKEFNRLLNKGVKLLSMREHSVQEITAKLSVKCESPDLVHSAVEQLIDNNYLSDYRFTESYIRSRTNRGFGPTKIRSELLNKGIKNNLIDDYLDVNSIVWYDNAYRQYKKKYGDEPIADYQDWSKRARFLQSRGFGMEHIHLTIPPFETD